MEVHDAWTAAEVRDAVHLLLDRWSHRLPDDRSAGVVLKPNLNNDLVALTGNSTDLRVLCSLVEALVDRGYRHVTVADGPNVGVERRGIDVLRRLRVDRLGPRYGIEVVDLNRAPARPVRLSSGVTPRVAELLLDADLVIDVPTVKTHAEMGLSAACKNRVGIVRGQDKRLVHRDLAANVASLADLLPRGLVVVDGLVGMEGNGPGDGEPYRLGVVAAGDDPWLVDLVLARLVGLDPEHLPLLRHGRETGRWTRHDAREVEQAVRPRRRARPAPPRSLLAELSEARLLHPLKLAVRPLVSLPPVARAAYRLRIVQDVYSLDDDTVTAVRRDPELCTDCRRCAAVCPTHLRPDEIGVRTDPDACIDCLYCWLTCPSGAIGLEGELRGMARQVARYKTQIETL